jgi:membrane protein required for colicin V production
VAIALTDWILLGVMLASMLVGLWRGLVYEVLSLAGWVAAFILSQWLAADVVAYLPFLKEAAAQVQYAVAFAVVFVVALFAAGLLSVVLQLLGLSQETWWKDAVGSAWLDLILKGLKPLLPQAFVAYLP